MRGGRLCCSRPFCAPGPFVLPTLLLSTLRRNWRGPAWVNVNALACYGLAAYGYRDLALEIATRVTATLARDLRSSSHTWHEAYSTDDGTPLGGAGFLSWDTLSADLVTNLRRGVDPLRLEP